MFILCSFGLTIFWKCPLLFKWLFNPDEETYDLWHGLQTYDRSLSWKRLCVLKCSFWVKLWSQTSQGKGFSPRCSLMWVLRLDWELKLLSHPSKLQRWGFSPEWTSACLCRWAIWEKSFLHSSHTNGLSPEWILMWVFKFDFCLKFFLQSLQKYSSFDCFSLDDTCDSRYWFQSSISLCKCFCHVCSLWIYFHSYQNQIITLFPLLLLSTQCLRHTLICVHRKWSVLHSFIHFVHQRNTNRSFISDDDTAVSWARVMWVYSVSQTNWDIIVKSVKLATRRFTSSVRAEIDPNDYKYQQKLVAFTILYITYI